MTYYYYKTNSWSTSEPKISEETKDQWKAFSKKKNWRITQLPNGYYQTEFNINGKDWTSVTRRETIGGAEQAIDASIDHYEKRLKTLEGPTVVKTFK